MLGRPIGPSLVLICLLSGCTPPAQKAQSEPVDDHRALAQQYLDEFDADPSLEVVERWVTADFVSHDVSAPEPHDLASYREALMPFLTGFTEIRHQIRESVSEGDRIALLVDLSMTHTGEFLGLEPTGRSVNVSEMLIFRIQDGKFAEEWNVFDFASLMA